MRCEQVNPALKRSAAKFPNSLVRFGHIKRYRADRAALVPSGPFEPLSRGLEQHFESRGRGPLTVKKSSKKPARFLSMYLQRLRHELGLAGRKMEIDGAYGRSASSDDIFDSSAGHSHFAQQLLRRLEQT